MKKDFESLFLNTQPLDRCDAVEAINKMYSICGKRKPEVIFADGLGELVDCLEEEVVVPEACNDFALKPFSFDDSNPITTFHTSRCVGKTWRLESLIECEIRKECTISGGLGDYGRDNLFMPVSYLYSRSEKPEYRWEWQEAATAIWDAMLCCVTYDGLCIIMDRPDVVHHNNRGYHNTKGPAVVFRDGSEIYAYEGEPIAKRLILDSANATLEDIHQGNSRKHIYIGLYGIERYLDLVKSHSVDVKGKFKNFYQFANIDQPTVEGNHEARFSKHMREWYENKPYELLFEHEKINGETCFCMWHEGDESFVFQYHEDPLKKPCFAKKVRTEDHELWKELNFRAYLRRGVSELTLAYKGGEFYLREKQFEDLSRDRLHRDVCPAWVKAHVMRGTDCHYEDEYTEVEVKGGELKVLKAPQKPRDPLFHGSDNVPYYNFKLDVKGKTWEEFLRNCADFSFEWLGMFEDSTQWC